MGLQARTRHADSSQEGLIVFVGVLAFVFGAGFLGLMPPPPPTTPSTQNCGCTPARASQRVKPDAGRRCGAAAQQRSSTAALDGAAACPRKWAAQRGEDEVGEGVRGQFTSSEGRRR